MNLGEKIKQLRKEYNLSQEQLAQKVDSVKSLIWKYEKNQASPSAEMIKRLAMVFKVSSDYLLFDKSEKENITRISDKSLLMHIPLKPATHSG